MDSDFAAICRNVLGREPGRVDVLHAAPRGSVRGTRRLHLGNRVVYATQRQDPAVTEKEARILRTLGKYGAPVPEVLAFQDGWLFVASAGSARLAETLARASTSEATALLRNAIQSLAALHVAGEAAALAESIPSFAHGAETAGRLLASLDAVGTLQGVAMPAFDGPGLIEQIAQPGTDFIKWDARPSNAAIGKDGVVRWFDWQHANRRHRADDLVWLLCDEFVPEEAQPAALLARTAHAWEGSADRVCALGCAHIGVRLNGILTGATGLDVPFATCLANDWLGSRESARRLCRRGAAVARESSLTKPLIHWFLRLAEDFRA